MKIKPEVLFSEKKEINFKKILVSGNDETLISFTTEYIINCFKKNLYFIDYSGDIKSGVMGNLFSKKKTLLYIKNPTSKINIAEHLNQDQHILVSSNTNKNINHLKLDFSKSKDSLAIDCYPLNRAGKELVIKEFIKTNKMKISTEVYWYSVENFENQYVFLTNQLHSLLLFNKEFISLKDIEKIVYVENKLEVSRLFFHILKSNKLLINFFNKNIYTTNDLYAFLSSLKLYLDIINSSKNKNDVVLQFPKYLFNEKEVFLKIYDSLNKKKIKKIYKNIFKVEKLLRSNSNFFSIIGLRFLLSTKKIIIS